MTDRRHLGLSLLMSLVLSSAGLLAQEAPVVERPSNWPAPLFWTPRGPPEELTAPQGKSFLEDKTPAGLYSKQAQSSTTPLPFVSISPCRKLDTRTTGGPIASGSTRDATLTGAPCGIPASAAAVSANFVVFNIVGAPGNGVLKVWPAGSPSTSQALINWPPTAGQIDNASVVPLGTGGAITLQPNQGGGTIDMIIDVNGYYAPETTLDTGGNNTAYGYSALHSNPTGGFNSAFGDAALYFDTTGQGNSAFGSNALSSNQTASYNSAFGDLALVSNQTGDSNAAFGRAALSNNNSSFNSAFGNNALVQNQTGGNNAAFGSGALAFNTAGGSNLAFGTSALYNTQGDNNIGIGTNAGFDLIGGSNNIYIGSNAGSGSEGNAIRIGQAQTAAFIAGINGTHLGTGVFVQVDPSGQLGTVSSSRRFKRDIRDMGGSSGGLFQLRPVSFRYTQNIDPTSLEQYGLIAEEVAEVYPDLVVYDRDGQPETVRYHFLVPMLLNEVQKQQKTIEDLRSRLEDQSREIEALKKAVASLTTRSE